MYVFMYVRTLCHVGKNSVFFYMKRPAANPNVGFDLFSLSPPGHRPASHLSTYVEFRSMCHVQLPGLQQGQNRD